MNLRKCKPSCLGGLGPLSCLGGSGTFAVMYRTIGYINV